MTIEPPILHATLDITWPTFHLHANLDIEAGSTLALMGPNGAGKSTIVRALAGLQSLHAGAIRIANEVWDEPASRQFVAPENRNVGLVFQDHVLFRHMNALDNVAFGLRARGMRVTRARELAQACLERLGLDAISRHTPIQLSGGQSQRVALARALVNRPSLLLLDEPLAALDVMTRRHIREEIAGDLAAYSPTTLLVTHDPDDAHRLADHIAIVEQGRIVQIGTTTEVTSNPISAYAAELFGDPS